MSIFLMSLLRYSYAAVYFNGVLHSTRNYSFIGNTLLLAHIGLCYIDLGLSNYLDYYLLLPETPKGKRNSMYPYDLYFEAIYYNAIPPPPSKKVVA